MKPASRAYLRAPRVQVEVVAAAWEALSALLFISAVVPAALATPWPALIFFASIAFSAALAPWCIARGARGYAIAGVVRAVSWPLAVTPLLRTSGPRVFVAALCFGLMAGGMRRSIYHWRFEAPAAELDDATLRKTLRSRLSESAIVVGILGGHALMLFCVAFLRTQSPIVFSAWFQTVPILATLGTIGYSFAVRPATDTVLLALAAGPGGDKGLLARGLAQALALPGRLANLNFAGWLGATAIGIMIIRPGPAEFQPGDAIMQLIFGSIFAWGVAFHQRAWHREILASVEGRLRSWTGAEATDERISLRDRMLRDFGVPLLFMAALSLLSSVGLYRALSAELTLREDFNAILALFASFGVLVVAAGFMVAKAARDLSKPMIELAEAADRVAHGRLDATVPRVTGPIEVVGLGESIEGMRGGLSRTIAELELERRGLEANVEARTAELRRALADLKQAQAALVQGERMASIGELVAGVAHEINNPLSAIAGASVPLDQLVGELREVLDAYRVAEQDLPPERRSALEKLRARVDLAASLDDLVGISSVIRRSIDRSVRIVTNLRNFSRSSGEQLPTDLQLGLEETLMLVASRIQKACIRVVRSYGPVPPVLCRAGEMNQVFMNLIVNAIQALEEPTGGRDGARAEATLLVETRLESGGEVAAVIIEDNGPGVPAALEHRVFDPFFTTKPRGQGTGLGLSISRDIARRHGGSLTLERLAAGGARFICRIPVGSRHVVRASATDPSLPTSTP